MKNIVFLYAGNCCDRVFDKVFDEKSSFDLTVKWAQDVKESSAVFILCTDREEDAVRKNLTLIADNGASVISKAEWNTRLLIQTMAEECKKQGSENAVFTFADRLFMDSYLSNEVIECHKKYIAEYTFADGYPYGFSPEVISAGTLNILSGMAKEDPVDNECIFNVMKQDINSFEIEAVIAPKDYRMLRFDFSCSVKRNFIACKRLYEAAKASGVNFNAKDLSDFAETNAAVQKTLPSFYNVQISSKYNAFPFYAQPLEVYCKDKSDMSLEKFSCLVKQISDFSEDAVISLSAAGEPLLISNLAEYVKKILEFPKLKVLIETDGTLVTEELASSIEVPGGKDRVIWIIGIDAATPAMYEKIWKNGSFEKAVNAVSILAKHFSQVYPQFTRMNENEEELEAFYRYYHAKESPSLGKLIIQKYDSFCKMLPDRKPADLSPLTRNPCWHLKRDMTILCDGTVPLCRECVGSAIGNAFETDIESIWKLSDEKIEEHLKSNYCGKCGDCDEYYTFNF